MSMFDNLAQDMRYAVRGLRRSPIFSLVAITTLAAGIGVNAAVFTVTNAVLLKGFALVRDNDRILYVTTGNPGCCVSLPDYEDWQAQAQSFAQMAATRGVLRTFGPKNDFPVLHLTHQVTPNAFKLLGVRPLLGRDFTALDSQPGAASVAILSYRFWQGQFGGRPSVVGETILLDGAATTVIGIMPRRFSFPESPDLWTPLVATNALQKRDARELWFAFGRLAPGATIETARAEMESIGRDLGKTYPLTNQGENLVPYVQTFDAFFMGSNATTIYKALWGAVSFVLLIACANVANLLLARAVVRSKEIGIRSALGAGRSRIVRQLSTESAILTIVASFLGWWTAKAAVRIYSSTEIGGWATKTLTYAMDYRVVAYLIAISVATGLLFGLMPALHLSNVDANRVLRGGTGIASGGRRSRRVSTSIIVSQMALAVVLLSGAGVMTRSFLNVVNSDIGIERSNVLTASIRLPIHRYADSRTQVAFYDRLIERVEAIPGVESAALSRSEPAGFAPRFQYELKETPSTRDEDRPTVSRVAIGPRYFRTLGAVVLAGRPFSDADNASGRPVVIVNRQFAEQHWPDGEALGKQIRLFSGNVPGAWLTVVGVVSNIIQNDPSQTRQSFEPLLYLPYAQVPSGNAWIFARTRGSPRTTITTFRKLVYSMDPALPIFVLTSLDQRLRFTSAVKGGVPTLFSIFAVVALLFASTGLYAVIAHSVNNSTREIGVLNAVGATGADIRMFVLREGMRPVAIGVVIGLAASLLVNQVLEGQLVGVSPGDPVALILASSVLLFSALMGCLIPARRAMRLAPAIALRHE